MITRRDAAQRLNISVDMAERHDIGKFVDEKSIEALEENPPAWLLQSRANRGTASRPVWVDLTCSICGYTQSSRPKKWWPEFTYLSCSDHDIFDLPEPAEGKHRGEYDDIGGYFIGIFDS
jgi:hypothetical protein